MSRDDNAERIWEEMKRRQGEDDKRKTSKRQRARSKSGAKPSKRISALAEVLEKEEETKKEILVPPPAKDSTQDQKQNE